MPVTLGRRGAVAAGEGDLVVAEGTRRARAACSRCWAAPATWPPCCTGWRSTRAWAAAGQRAGRARAGRPAARSAAGRRRGAPTCATGSRSRSIRPTPATSTTPSPSSASGTACACSSTSPTCRAFVAAGGRARPRGRAARLLGVPARPGRADAAASAVQRRLQPAAGRRPLRGHGRAWRRTATSRAYRSMIRSDHRLSYPQVERMLAGDEPAPPPLRQALEDARRLAAASCATPASRAAPPASTAASSSSRSPTARVVAAEAAAEHEAHMLVEELMLLANERVAELLAGARADAVFRVHEHARAGRGAAAGRAAGRAGGADPAAARPARRPRGGRLRGAGERVGDALHRSSPAAAGWRFRCWCCGRCSGPATTPETSATPAWPAAAYCHFTSPIRRYPDLIVHRALLAHLGAAERSARRRRAGAGGRAKQRGRARRGARRAARRRRLPGLPARARAVRAGLGAAVRGRGGGA